MQPYIKHTSIAALMDRSNVDTDQIIPKNFMKKVERTGFGINLFHNWRFLADNITPNPAFELNKPAFQGAKILVAGENFGCGSSREHAPWAIADYGFNTIISTSFADIFHSNCFKNSILPIVVTAEQLASLMAEIAANEGVEFTIDLPEQKVTTPGGIVINFDVDAFRKESLIDGLDDIAWTLKHVDKITAYEEANKKKLPWLWPNA
ncbi:3-isopropylmalate dehydratase small subunit [Psychromonas sp. Urea-02u-13]|uniref:3-isopropylmalate dehydratase small subunit n=1 Tax=Psychromonas sp. Urea-02u-13 TaxID=2058326 RepID=UPI000C34992A|nr:3-isopropylmalate dehydratase small subunit [Psychromonas sp. Urea-02u-13]PKG38345.1 3-isopropylmalate dehydratase small subunit [Psychromonas sp. Urea-02u-13]